MLNGAHIDIGLWFWPLTGDPAGLLPLLSEDERRRAGRFVRPMDAAAFTLARSKLRQILGQSLGQRPESLRFSYSAYGKPSLTDHPEIDFSLSHSGGFAALAIARDLSLGLDIEAPRPVEPEIADYYFALEEREELARLSGDAWQEGFFNAWTRKEAVIKAEGLGLSMPLRSFAVSLTPGAPARLSRIDFGAPEDWSLFPLSPHPALKGALAVKGASAPVRLIAKEGWPR